MNKHRESAAHFRALAVLAKDRADASPLGNVHEAQARAAARWDALADLEDMYLERATERYALAAARTAAAEAEGLTTGAG